MTPSGMLLYSFGTLLLLLSPGGSWIEGATTPDRDIVSDDEDTQIVQYKISRFGIVLEPTYHKITDDMVTSFLSPVIEATLFDALGGDRTQSTFVLLASAFVEGGDRRQLTETTNSTTIIVKGGLINFRSRPPADEVPGVIREGINEDLVHNLPDNIAFEGIKSATFLPLNNEQLGTAPPVLVSPNTNANSNKEQASTSTSDILFVVLGSSGLLLLLAGMVLRTRRMRKERLPEESKSLKDTSFETQGTNDASTDQMPSQEYQYDDDNRSVNSEWTSATTDHQYLAKSQYLAAEETFQRNSLMAVKKDMLQSEWSSTNHPRNNNNNNSSLFAETEFQAAERENHRTKAIV